MCVPSPKSSASQEMAATVDSTAVFSGRLRDVGLAADDIERFVAGGIDTHAKFAFAVNYQPGAADDTAFIALVNRLLPDGDAPAPAGKIACARRLFFESYTLCAAEMRAKLDQPTDAAPRKLAAAEREHRRAEQQRNLSGLALTGELEVAHSLVDLLVQQYEDNELRYVEWSKCATRAQEIMAGKSEPALKTDSHGMLRLVANSRTAVADVATDLKASLAVQRRGLAMEQAQLMSYSVHERWRDRLFQQLLRPHSPGFNPIGLQQLMRADQELFRVMAEECREGIQRKPDGSLPLDEALVKAMDSPQVMFYLLPTPASRASHGVPQKAAKRKAMTNNTDDDEPSPKRSRRKSTAKGKGRGKGQKFVPMPQGLKGMDHTTPSGEPICFRYNLPGGCSAAADGMKCNKGVHRCARPGCHGAHSLQSCTKGH